MRQWMVPPVIMCNSHLLGEHVEHHMFAGHMKRKKSVRKYIDNNCLEPLVLKERHDQLASEIDRRKKEGMFSKNSKGHQSPFVSPDVNYLSEIDKNHKIDILQNLHELLKRCPECNKNFNKLCKSHPQVVVISL